VASTRVDYEARLSVGSGFRFGVGFMSAAVLFSIVLALVWLMLLGALIGAAFGR
jgi:hypothetical protein